ncbi:glucosamine inositolphosphorylceramide transferase family protein [Marilutibacter chinensis]|uniref:Glucosamine inositolphosphorylceramide transferase 1 N-terminal domain-containing protein n=1 Tax=Marilutibacter chinensis TaxID=2912247 RepID=A0ABS9HPS1_9GAMM|nr:hypothetical protein [Lysobacter chinensis]MCF7220945.1 hypothetical protein [Lysobacter chinensis]
MMQVPDSPRGAPSGESNAPSDVSPLYLADVRRAGPLRVVLVTPATMPGWLDDFMRLAGRAGWLDVDVLPVAGAKLPGSDCRRPELRMALAVERWRSPAGTGFATVVPVPQSGMARPPSAPESGRDAALMWLRERRPDLVILAADLEGAAEIAAGARRGCWRLDASLLHECDATFVLLSPLIEPAATTVGLEADRVDGTWRPLAVGTAATYRASLSGQRERACRKLPALLLRGLLAELHAPEPAAGDRRVVSVRLVPPSCRPGRLATVRAFVATIGVRVRDRWNRACSREGRWSVLVRRQSEAMDPDLPSASGYCPLVAPHGCYWADPCAIDGPDGDFVYVEECPDEVNAGVIACLRVDAAGQAERLGVALQRPCHLSFPQVFDWEGRRFMTVESGQDCRVTLYECGGSPLDWRPLADLIEGWQCVDPVLHFHAGHWFLFVNVAESGASSCDSLFLFVADTLTGPYRPHPANPIVDDAGRARMAGRLFVDRGRLVRPAQDCVGSYGAAIVFNEVLELGPDRYRERMLGRLDAEAAGARDGCHTYSRAGALEAIDVRGFGLRDAVPASRHPGHDSGGNLRPGGMSTGATARG